jgi:zinc transport system substrate-binding protein
MRLKLFSIMSIVFVLVTGCSQSNTASNEIKKEGKLEINTTIYPVKYFTERIGGEYVNVTNLIPPGSDAHTFEPTSKEMIKIAESDALIYNGANMEPFIGAVKDSLQDESVEFFEASKGVDLDEAVDEDHENEDQGSNAEDNAGEHSKSGDEDHAGVNVNPHIWLDPVRAITMAENIKETLTKLRPEEQDTFESNFQKLKQDLQTLNKEFKKMVKQAQKNTFLVSHAAYGYWEDRYGLNELSISGLSPSDEPSQKQLEEIVEKAKMQDISYVLFEQNVSQKVAEVIQQEIGAGTLQLHNLSTLTEENIKQGHDYFSLMKKNIQTLKKALQ